MDKLGMSTAEQAQIKEVLDYPHGIILVTGPTGAGKSTSLNAFLRQINSTDLRIITIEDPIGTRSGRQPDAGRGRDRPAVRERAPPRAVGPRRHHGGRDPRPRDGRHRYPRVADRPPCLLDPPHERRAGRHPPRRHGDRAYLVASRSRWWLVDALRHRQVPDERPRREGPQPVAHRRVGQPGGRQVEGGRGRRLGVPLRRLGCAEPDGDDLEVVDEPRREEPAGPRVRLKVGRYVEARDTRQFPQHLVLGAGQGRDQRREAGRARGLEDRLALLVGQARGDGLGKGVLEQRGHRKKSLPRAAPEATAASP